MVNEEATGCGPAHQDPARTSGLAATTVSRHHGLLELRPEWQRLERRASRRTVSAGLALQSARATGDVRVVVVRDGQGRLQGLWPLAVERMGPVRIAGRLGRGLQTYDGLVVQDEIDASAVVAAAWREVQRWTDVDLIKLDAVEAADALLGVSDLADRAEACDQTVLIDLSRCQSVEELVSVQSRSQRKSLRRRRRKLEALGELRADVVSDPDERRRAAAWAWHTKRRWLDAQRAPSPTFRASWFREGLLAAAADPSQLESLVVHRLTVDGRTAAVELGFRDTTTYRSFVAAFDDALSDLGVGVQLSLATVDWTIREGLASCDFLPPVTEFKERWGHEVRAIYRAIVPLSRRGRLVEPAIRHGKQRLKALHQQLPPTTRDRLWRLQDKLAR